MKKKIVAIIVIGVVACLFIFWALRDIREGEIQEENQSQLTLRVLIGGGDTSWENCMQEVATDYMETHPNIKINIQTVDNIAGKDYEKALVIEEAKGNFDGIVEMQNTELYVKEKKLAKLSEELTNQMKYEESTEKRGYTIARYHTCGGIIYNKKIFEELRLNIPKDYSEFLELCEKLKEEGKTPLTVGAKDIWHLKNWSMMLFYKDVLMDDENWISKRNENKVSWSDRVPKQVIEEFVNLFEKGYVGADYESTTDAETIERLVEGKAAMLCSGPWMFSQIMKVNPEFEIGWFFFPQNEEGREIILDEDWEWGITKACEENGKYEIAVDFLKFYYSDAVYKKVLEQMNGISSKKDLEAPFTLSLQKEIGEEINRRGKRVEKNEMPAGFRNIWLVNMLKAAKGEQSIDETAKILDEEWEKCIAEE